MTSFCTDQGLVSNITKNIYQKLVPQYNKKLIQESYQNLDDKIALKEPKNKCDTFCGKTLPKCKSKWGTSYDCETTFLMKGGKTQKDCEKIGKPCIWGPDWRPCTPECKKWDCNNCKNKTYNELTNLNRDYYDILNEYKENYKKLLDSDLTKTDRDEIYNKVESSNEKLLEINQILYDKIIKSNIDLEKLNSGTENKNELIKEKNKETQEITYNSNNLVKNNLRVDYARTRYIFWLVITCVLIGSIIIISFNIKLPGMGGSFMYVYLLGLICLVWFLLSQIWKEFKQSLR